MTINSSAEVWKTMKKDKGTKAVFLTCERDWVYFTLIVVAGFWGAYTYLLRGNVFCNAQSGNVVLMGLALGSGNWGNALYYLVPISAYTLGAFVSELAPAPVRQSFIARWETILILIEMAAVLFLGSLPESAPVQISQVVINFIASMQYNTFRQAEGIPVATTFVTNHIRQIGIGMAKEFQNRHTGDKSHREKLTKHVKMVFFFISGSIIGTIFCSFLVGRAIWITLIPLGIIFATFLRADLTTEKHLSDKKPAGR